MSFRGIDPYSFSNRYVALAMLNAQRQMAALSSGDRIFAASEDPAGLIISEQLRSQIVSLNAEIENLSATSNKYTYADSVLVGMHNQLIELRSLAVAASNDATNSPEAQAAYNRAAADLVAQYNKSISQSEYNGHKLLDGSEGALANIDQLEHVDLSNAAWAQAAIASIDDSMHDLQMTQVDLGAKQKNELDSRRWQLEVTRENLIASESGIRDTDFVSVFADFVANSIKARVGLALSAYARYSGVDVVKLLDR